MNKRVVIDGLGQPLRVDMAPIPEAPALGMVVKVHFAGICQSDVAVWKDIKRPYYPFVLGHEVAGEVHAVGPGYCESAEEFEVGERVVVYPWVGCASRDCDYCCAGEASLCRHRDHLGVITDGGFQSYVVVKSRRYVLHAPAALPLDELCLFSCSALTAFNAISRLKPAVKEAVRIKGKANVMLIGVGGLGLWALQWAKIVLPKDTVLIAVDVSNEKLDLAREYGAHKTVLWELSSQEKDKDIGMKLKKQCGGDVDGVVDFIDNQHTVTRSIVAASRGAALALVGMKNQEIGFNTDVALMKALTFHFIFVGAFSQFREALHHYQSAKVKSPPITHVTPEEADATIRKLTAGNVRGRAVIDMRASRSAQL